MQTRMKTTLAAAGPMATRIELDLHLERGLLPLAAGSARIGTLTVTGAARGVRRADGTTSFADLFPVSSAARTEEGPTEPAAAPAQRVGVVLDGVDLRLHDEASGEEIQNIGAQFQQKVADGIWLLSEQIA